jgi:DedD protein
MPPTADAQYDELKRKARRRLVGAVVLALAAAVFVPMLLESDERPLGDDVSVRIPPVDQGKFVNRLNAPAGMPPAAPRPAPSKSDAGAAAAPTHDVASTPAPQPAASGAIAAPPAAPAGDAGKAPAPAANPATSPANADASSPAKGASAAKPVATSAKPGADSPARTVAAKAAASGYVVQLAAFADDKGANALANRLKKSGHPAFTEPVTTSHGTLWRVRVGPYATRDEANTARDKLKREGQNGIVAARAS